MQACQHVYMALVQGSINVSSRRAHCCKADTTAKAVPVNPDTHISDLHDQLIRMADDPNTGEITGKTAGGDNDDAAMAFLIAMYWSACAMAAVEMREHASTSSKSINNSIL